jgi:uncharacterized protein (DUF302 family)
MMHKTILRHAPKYFAMALVSASLAFVAAGDAAAGQDVVTKSVKAPFGKVVTKLKKAIASRKLVIVKQIPFQKMVAMVGVKTSKTLGFEVFHPRYGKTIIAKDLNALIDVPLRLVLRQEGSKVILQYRKPSAVFAPYSGLSGLGKQLDSVFADIAKRTIN